MRAVLVIAWRDFRALFLQPLAWIILSGYLVLSGMIFNSSLRAYLSAQSNPRMADQMHLNNLIVDPLFNTQAAFMLVIVPLVTMRLLAEEFRLRTDELWMTSPVGIWQILGGKYLAAMGFFSVLVAASLINPLVLTRYGDPEVARIWTNALGFLLTVGCLAAGALFVSSLTENVVVAAVGGFAINTAFWIVIGFGDVTWYGRLLAYLSIPMHYFSLTRGLLDIRDLVYFASYMVFFLYLTARSLESRSWR